MKTVKGEKAARLAQSYAVLRNERESGRPQLTMLREAETRRPILQFSLPIKTTNASNMQRGNSRTIAIIRSQEDSKRRNAAYTLTLSAMRNAGISRVDLVPCIVRLTRVSAGRLDGHDALAPALKRVVDGIAQALGIDDGGPFVQWQYDQRRGPPKHYAVLVAIVRMA